MTGSFLCLTKEDLNLLSAGLRLPPPVHLINDAEAFFGGAPACLRAFLAVRHRVPAAFGCARRDDLRGRIAD